MVSVRPSADPKGKYSISETCRLLGIHRHTLRKYTDEGLIKCGYGEFFRKFYTGMEILKLWNKM